MKHFTSSKFWQHFDALPANIQQQARANYELLKQNPQHPSLKFKPVKNGAFRSVRVSSGYRALGVPVDLALGWAGFFAHRLQHQTLGSSMLWAKKRCPPYLAPSRLPAMQNVSIVNV